MKMNRSKFIRERSLFMTGGGVWHRGEKGWVNIISSE